MAAIPLARRRVWLIVAVVALGSEVVFVALAWPHLKGLASGTGTPALGYVTSRFSSS